MSDEAVDILSQLRSLLLDLNIQVPGGYFPIHTEMKSMDRVCREMADFSIKGTGKYRRQVLSRWIKEGWRGVRLKAVKFMYRWYTCDHWIREFIREASKVPQERHTGLFKNSKAENRKAYLDAKLSGK